MSSAHVVCGPSCRWVEATATAGGPNQWLSGKCIMCVARSMASQPHCDGKQGGSDGSAGPCMLAVPPLHPLPLIAHRLPTCM